MSTIFMNPQKNATVIDTVRHEFYINLGQGTKAKILHWDKQEKHTKVKSIPKKHGACKSVEENEQFYPSLRNPLTVSD